MYSYLECCCCNEYGTEQVFPESPNLKASAEEVPASKTTVPIKTKVNLPEISTTKFTTLTTESKFAASRSRKFLSLRETTIKSTKKLTSETTTDTIPDITAEPIIKTAAESTEPTTKAVEATTDSSGESTTKATKSTTTTTTEKPTAEPVTKFKTKRTKSVTESNIESTAKETEATEHSTTEYTTGTTQPVLGSTENNILATVSTEEYISERPNGLSTESNAEDGHKVVTAPTTESTTGSYLLTRGELTSQLFTGFTTADEGITQTEDFGIPEIEAA
jgi:hypothetical protein